MQLVHKHSFTKHKVALNFLLSLHQRADFNKGICILYSQRGHSIQKYRVVLALYAVQILRQNLFAVHGVDKDSGLIHTLEVTAANAHDVTMTSKLLTGEETAVYGDSGYLGAEKREDAILTNHTGKHIRYKINRRLSRMKKGPARSLAQLKRREHEKSSVRAKAEHVFGVVKGLLRYRKTRYRGLRKQTAKLNMLFALANLILADRPSLAV